MTKTTDTKTPTEAVEDTRTAAELENAIASGTDMTVTADQLRAARDREKLAGLRAEGEKSIVRRAAEKARHAKVDKLCEDVAACKLRPLDGLAEAAYEALVAYLDAVDARNDELHWLARRARDLGVTGDTEYIAGRERIGLPYAGGGSMLRVRCPNGDEVRLNTGDREDLADEVTRRALAKAPAERERARRAAEPQPPQGYFITEGGNPFVFNVPLNRARADQLERGELTQISRAEYDRMVAERKAG